VALVVVKGLSNSILFWTPLLRAQADKKR